MNLSNVRKGRMGDQKYIVSRASPCFGRHVKPLVLAAFAVVPTNLHWARVVGYGPFSLCTIHKEPVFHYGLVKTSINLQTFIFNFHVWCIALIKWVSRSSLCATANWCMINDIAFCVGPTGVHARIDAFVIITRSLGVRTFRIQFTTLLTFFQWIALKR
jgi:hypothetical protein